MEFVILNPVEILIENFPTVITCKGNCQYKSACQAMSDPQLLLLRSSMCGHPGSPQHESCPPRLALLGKGSACLMLPRYLFVFA